MFILVTSFEGAEKNHRCPPCSEADSTTNLGGEGGGHNIAAGARIPAEKKKDFLKDVDSLIKEQMSSRK